MDSREVEESRKRELRAILDSIRYECTDLIDEYFLAWFAAGRTVEEWQHISEWNTEWFRLLRTEKLTFEEERGALKIVRAHLQSQIETLKLEALYRQEARPHGKQRTAAVSQYHS